MKTEAEKQKKAKDDDVIREAGLCGKAHFYHYFKSKHEAYAALLRRILAEVLGSAPPDPERGHSELLESELLELEQTLPDFRLILTMTQDPGWEGESRKVDGEFVEDYLDDDLNGYTFLVAGPPAMAEGVQTALQEAGVRDENVIAERYSGY